jgi:hypothetical protein
MIVLRIKAKKNQWGQASVPAYKNVSFADSLFFKNGNKELFFI